MNYNVILDQPSESVFINGNAYKIETDFKNWLNFKILIDGDPTHEEITVALSFIFEVFPDEPLDDIAKAIVSFMTNTETAEKDPDSPVLMRDLHKADKDDKGKRIIDYESDADYIYSAFMQTYGIDLQTVDMHWHKFQALFIGLPEDTKIKQAMSYRSIEPSDMADLSKSEKKRIKKFIEFYALPDNRTQDEIDKEFANSL